MRRTKKYLAAQKKARELNINSRLKHAALYEALNAKGYVWEHKKGQWIEGSTSLFADHTGAPSGLVRIRVMAHPHDVEKAVQKLQKAYRVVEVSEQYLNRRGQGVRIYATVLLE